MMYPYLTLNDQTEITHSEMKEDGSVKVYIETPDENGGFHSAVCWLPQYRWEKIQGYTEQEMAFFQHVSLACSVFWQKGQILVKDRLHVACELGAKGTGPDIIEHNGVGLTAVD